MEIERALLLFINPRPRAADYQTFLAVEHGAGAHGARGVRGRRRVYSVTTAGDGLALAVKALAEDHPKARPVEATQ